VFVHLPKFQEEKGCWLWKKPPPLSKKPMNVVDPIDPTKIQIVRPKAKKVSFKIKDRLLKGILSLVLTINLFLI
jgi:E3 ubiquitin-protein ligase UHRF1